MKRIHSLGWTAILPVLLLTCALIGCGSSSKSSGTSSSPSPTPGAPTPGAGGGAASGGTYVYVRTSNTQVSGFRLASNGSLTALPGSPFAVGGYAIAVAGTHLFSAGSGQLLVYGIDPATGAVASQSQASVANAGEVAAQGGNVYVTGTSSSGDIAVVSFSVAQSGALTSLSAAPVVISTGCSLCAIPGALTVDARYLVVGEKDGEHSSGSLIVLARQGNGTVQKTSSFGANAMFSLALAPSDRAVYSVQSGEDSILVSSLDSNGQVKLVQDFNLQTFTSVAADPSGRFVIGGSLSSLASFTLNSDGTIGAQRSSAAVPVSGGFASAVFDPSGRWVVLAQSNALATYSFDPSSGALAKSSTTSIGASLTPPVVVTF